MHGIQSPRLLMHGDTEPASALARDPEPRSAHVRDIEPASAPARGSQPRYRARVCARTGQVRKTLGFKGLELDGRARRPRGPASVREDLPDPNAYARSIERNLREDRQVIRRKTAVQLVGQDSMASDRHILADKNEVDSPIRHDR